MHTNMITLQQACIREQQPTSHLVPGGVDSWTLPSISTIETDMTSAFADIVGLCDRAEGCA